MRAVIGRGCEECAGTGYRGRAGIYEFLPVSDPIRQLILERASADVIKDAARPAAACARCATTGGAACAPA